MTRTESVQITADALVSLRVGSPLAKTLGIDCRYDPLFNTEAGRPGNPRIGARKPSDAGLLDRRRAHALNAKVVEMTGKRLFGDAPFGATAAKIEAVSGSTATGSTVSNRWARCRTFTASTISPIHLANVGS